MFSYGKLWKKLIDNKMTREQLRISLELSPSTIAKMGRNDYTSMEVLNRLCTYFDCQPGDLIEYIPDTPDKSE